MSGTESVPTTWDVARDEAFFRIVAHLLSAEAVACFSSLLAANDPDLVDVRD